MSVYIDDNSDPNLGPLDFVSGISLDGALWRAFYVASKNARSEEHRQLVDEVRALRPISLETYSDFFSGLTAGCSFAAQMWRDIESAFVGFAARHVKEGQTFEVSLLCDHVCYEVLELGLRHDACLTFCQHMMNVIRKPDEEGIYELWLVDQGESSQVGAPFFNFQLAAIRGQLELRKVA